MEGSIGEYLLLFIKAYAKDHLELDLDYCISLCITSLPTLLLFHSSPITTSSNLLLHVLKHPLHSHFLFIISINFKPKTIFFHLLCSTIDLSTHFFIFSPYFTLANYPYSSPHERYHSNFLSSELYSSLFFESFFLPAVSVIKINSSLGKALPLSGTQSARELQMIYSVPLLAVLHKMQ